MAIMKKIFDYKKKGVFSESNFQRKLIGMTNGCFFSGEQNNAH